MALPNQAPEAPEAEQAQPAAGGAAELVTGIHDGLTKLMELVSKTPAVGAEAPAALAQILQSYEAFTESLGQPAGEAAPQEAPGPGHGTSGMEAGGNPNARPM